MAITGISSYDGKQIIAAGAQSATKAYQDSNGDVITSKYQTTAGMSNYATTASVTGKQDKLTFGYTDDQISQINGSAIYSQGGGGGGVVTATGGTTAYVQTINNKNISATNAGSALSATNAYNLTNTAIKVASATSASTAYTLGNTAIKVASAGSASTAYTLGNTAIKVASATSANYALAAPQTQSDWNVTATGNAAYIKNKPSLWTPTIYHYENATTLTTGSGQQIGSEGIYVKFNPGNFLTNYTIDACRMIAEHWNTNIWLVRLSICIKDVIATQWSYNANALTVSGGHISNGPALFNCFSEWTGSPWCQLAVYSNWDTDMKCINRDIRNSSTADNHKLFINLEMEIQKA